MPAVTWPRHRGKPMQTPLCATAAQYNEAIQNLANSVSDDELRQGGAATNALGLPLLFSGGFADVYKVHCAATGNTWAVKCFTKATPGLRERYREISTHLDRVKLPFMTDFQYVEPGIHAGGQWRPFLKMRWIEGFNLNQFVYDYLDKPKTVRLLLQLWVKLASRLREAEVAHADLQHGNVLLVPAGQQGLSLKLIDYDGMFVPSLVGTRSGELGHPCYQHPQRLREGTYNLEVDRFSHLAIYCAIHGLIVGRRPLWKRFDSGDNLLFREVDFRNPAASGVLRELWGLRDPDVRSLAGHLILATQRPLDEVPLLDELVKDGQVRSLTRSEQQQVERVMGQGAARGLAAASLSWQGTAPAGAAGTLPAPTAPESPSASGQKPWWVTEAAAATSAAARDSQSLGGAQAAGPPPLDGLIAGAAMPPPETGVFARPPRPAPRPPEPLPRKIFKGTALSLWAVVMFGVGACRLFDRGLGLLAGEGNSILHNFFRFVALVGLTAVTVLAVAVVPALWSHPAAPTTGGTQGEDEEVLREASEALRLEPVAEQTVEAGSQLTVALFVEDAPRWEGKLRYALGPDAPPGAKIDPETGAFTWTPPASQRPGKYGVTVSVEGPDGRRHQTSFTITVSERGQPPPPEKTIAVDLGGGVRMEMVLIPAGELRSDDRRQRPVQIAQPFCLGKYEVTQEQWQAVMGNNPSHFKGPKHPVEQVSWDDCQEFVAKLNQRHGSGGATFSLPTKAQWEYAARAGSTAKWCFGDDDSGLGEYAWYSANSRTGTHPVGEKKPNAWDLYDVHGNVTEWCQDTAGIYRMMRGGGWAQTATFCQVAFPTSCRPGDRRNYLGLRVARTAPGRDDPAAPDTLRLVAVGSQSVAAGTPLTVAMSVENPTRWSGKLRYRLVEPAPLGARIDPQDGTFTWTPQAVHVAARHDVTVSVEGPAGQRDQTRFSVQVVAPSESTPKEVSIDLGGAVTMELVWIPAGEFLMGSSDSDSDARADEKPRHRVRITQPFFLGKYEVTQEQWQAVMGNNPSSYKGPKYPVDNVSWTDCQDFCDTLNAKFGAGGGKFRLPTEAQWEYACRAGSTTKWCFGDDAARLGDYAWHRDNSSASRPQPVGQKKPNAWGLYDVHGSIAEWCADWYDSSYYRNSPSDDPAGPASGFGRVRRDGWWHNAPKEMRSAGYRLALPPGFRNSDTGFRVARDATPQQSAGATSKPETTRPLAGDVSGLAAVDVQRDRVYHLGDWRMFWPAGAGVSGSTGDVFFWYKDASVAVGVYGTSNGWWHVRHGGREFVVWSAGGDTSPQNFFRRPWEQARKFVSPVIRAFREFQVSAGGRTTRVWWDGGNIVVDMPEGGKVTMAPASRVVHYTTKSGKTVQFPSR